MKNDQIVASGVIKEIVLDCDPDFTKMTSDEAARIEAAENSGFVDDCDIDWSKIGQ